MRDILVWVAIAVMVVFAALQVTTKQSPSAQENFSDLKKELANLHKEEKIAEAAPAGASEKEDAPENQQTVETPPAPETFQTFIFNLQVVMKTRVDPADASKKLTELCGILNAVSDVKNAVPVQLYGVYKDAEGKTHCKELTILEEKE